MASIQSAVAVPAPAYRESINCELHRFASGLKSSSLSGTRLNLPSLSQKFRSLELLVGHKGETRGAKGLEDGNLVPANHRMKVPSITLEELRNAGRNRYSSVMTSIIVVGLSVHTAPVSMREKLAVPEAEWPRAIGELCQFSHVEEAAVLSTCNRLEIYVVALSWNQGVQEVIQWMSKTSGIPAQSLREHLFILRDSNATQHLFKVSSGLDSLVIGEGQILSQVKQVCRVGELAPEFGRNLTGLFKQAISAGKRVRSETSIAAGAVSVSSAAVELAVMKLTERPIQTAQVLIIGAGKMSKLLVKHLLSKGCLRIVVVNRSEQRVLELQAEFAEAELFYQPMSEMMRCAAEAEVIFTSTASDVPLFVKKDVENLSSPSGGVRYFIDISVPRNVADCVAEVESARVYNVDDLKEVVESNKEERKRTAVEAQVIIDEELQSFEAWRASLQTVPTIKKLRAYAESIRTAEVEKCLGKMGNDLTTKNRKEVDDLSRGIVNKLLHGPMQHLRSDGTGTRPVDQILENMHVLERMFDLK